MSAGRWSEQPPPRASSTRMPSSSLPAAHRTRPRSRRRSAAPPGSWGSRPATTSPGSSSTLRATRSMPCCEPLMTSTSSALAAMPRAPAGAATHSRSGRKPSVMPYCSAAPGLLFSDASTWPGRAPGGKELRGGQAAGEREHVGTLGDLEDLPHRGRSHPRHAARRSRGCWRSSVELLPSGVMRVSSFIEQRTMVVWVRVTPASGAQLLGEQPVERAGVLGAHLEQVRVLAGDPVALEHLARAPSPSGRTRRSTWGARCPRR